MYKPEDILLFRSSDLHFVKRFGLERATQMIGDFYSVKSIPFLFDTYQLAAFLRVRRKVLFPLARNPETMYYPATIPKKNGDLRQLRIPNLILRNIQRQISGQILSRLPISPYATAYRSGCNIYQNAAPHCGKRYLLKMDIRDFYGSIRFDQVYKAAFHTGHYPVQIGTMLTSLCCYQEHLPQGAPTSPALSNLVMKNFDDQIGAWCKKHRISYTRYSDDLTFSADTPLYHVYAKAKSFLNNMGFELNDKKTRFVTSASCQKVTGLVVNESTPTISRLDRRELRQELYYAEKFGVADAIVRGNHTAFIENGIPRTWRYLDHLEGRVMYMLQVMKEDAFLLEARKRIRKCRLNTPAEDFYYPYFGYTL